MNDFEILTTCRAWRATPWDYSSGRSLIFRSDSTCDIGYGYGQTIYAWLKGRFEIPESGILAIEYLESPPFQRFAGFKPTTENQFKKLSYRLTEEETTGIESIVAQPYKFLWMLEIAGSAYPDGIFFPYGIPTVFYGHEVKTNAADTA